MIVISKNGKSLSKNAREIVRKCFVMGLNMKLMLRVRIERLSTLWESFNLAKHFEWEVEFVKRLVRRNQTEVQNESPVG